MNDFANFSSVSVAFLASEFFFLAALLIHRDPSQALFYGAVGLLAFFIVRSVFAWFCSQGFLRINRQAPPENKQSGDSDPKRDGHSYARKNDG